MHRTSHVHVVVSSKSHDVLWKYHARANRAEVIAVLLYK